MIINKVNNFINKKRANQRIFRAKESLNKPQSVLFYTTHKCASSFINPLLKTLIKYSDYKLFDYAKAIRSLGNNLDINQENAYFLKNFLEKSHNFLFLDRGEIYAPLRFPIDFAGRKNFKHIFFLRDPRDVVVSAYYSFGFTHPLPNNIKARMRVQEKRQSIQQQGIDNYAITESKERFLPIYEEYIELIETCSSFLYLRYSDFQDDTIQFIEIISDFLEVNISKEEIQELATKASPIQITRDNSKHKRSGKSKQYLEELKPDTINTLNEIFSEVLKYWDFRE